MRDVLIGLLTFAASLSAYANDTVAALGVGGVIAYGKTDAVAMRKEVLEISPRRIEVVYEFVNETDSPVTLTVAFPLPPYRAALPSPEYSGQPLEFSLVIDGQERPFSTSIRAVTPARLGVLGVDVTDFLREIGLSWDQIALLPGSFPGDDMRYDLSPFAPKGPKTIPKPTAEQYQRLREVRLLEPDVNAIDAPVISPAWDVHVAYHWPVTFPPGKVVSISHAYSPFVGDSQGLASEKQSSSDDRFTSSYCASSALVQQLRTRAKARGWISGGEVDYILQSANAWKGPIKDFTLRIKKTTPVEVVSLCFPGSFKRVDAVTLESHLTNFSPGADLKILYIQPESEALRPYGEFQQRGVAPLLREPK